MVSNLILNFGTSVTLMVKNNNITLSANAWCLMCQIILGQLIFSS
jgi:hypothetical protein